LALDRIAQAVRGSETTQQRADESVASILIGLEIGNPDKGRGFQVFFRDANADGVRSSACAWSERFGVRLGGKS
jgi:hypothetical protein